MPGLARLLADAPQAWHQATGEERRQIAGFLFEEAWIKNEEVVASWPRPELEPFFVLDRQSRGGTGGSDGIRTRDLCLDRAAC